MNFNTLQKLKVFIVNYLFLIVIGYFTFGWTTISVAEPFESEVNHPEITTTESEATSQPFTPKVGLFITSLYGFDLKNQSFNVIFWLWFIHKYKDYHPEKTTEIVNAHSYLIDKSSVIPRDNDLIWANVKFSGKIGHNWDISHFPFDRQVLEISMEDSEQDASGVAYIVDKRSSKIDNNIELPDWYIVDFELDSQPITYLTSYGDPDLAEEGKSTYNRLVAKITLKRKGTRLFFNMFTALYIAFILAGVAFCLPLEETSSRLSLATAAIFSSIGNKYVVDSMLPPTAILTLVDKLQISTFVFIGIMVIITVSNIYFKKNHEKLMEKINHYGTFALPTLYIALHGYWIYISVNSNG